MSKANIAILSDEDLTKVCGGGFGANFKKGFATELGKQSFLVIAAPAVITASVGVSLLTKWAVDKLTKKLDQKLDAS